MSLARGYETQVKVFMLMVVLFLVSANLVTVVFLSRSQSLLQDEARSRAVAASLSMARAVSAEDLPARVQAGEPGAGAVAGERLETHGRVHGATVVEIVDRGGRVIASSQSWRVGAVEAPESLLDPASAGALRAGAPALGRQDDAGLTTVFVPLRGEGGLILRAGYVLEAAGAISRQIRVLAWAQGIGGTVVLLLVLLFTRFVLKPYRELSATAAGLQSAEAPTGPVDDPAFLVASFRGVVDKMRSLEGELDRMRSSSPATGSQESLLSSLSSGVLILDSGGSVSALNRAGESILGLRGVEAIGRRAADLLPGSPELAAMLEDAVAHGRGRSREVVAHRTPSGRTVHLGVTVSGPPGGGSGALCLFSDLTEIRGVQQRVMLKENLARLGELSAGIAHEFRNSLGTILGYARLASRDEEAGGNAQAIVREVQSMGRIVDEFLRYAGPARLQKADVDLETLLREVAREAIPASGADGVVVGIEGEWPSVLVADESLLRQAFHNLVRNAVEAAAAGGAPRRVSITGRVGNGGVTVEVADTGPGFAPEMLARLFTPFVTTKDGGTGLGMALAQKIIVSHDGSVEVSNGPVGASVTVVLPLA